MLGLTASMPDSTYMLIVFGLKLLPWIKGQLAQQARQAQQDLLVLQERLVQLAQQAQQVPQVQTARLLDRLVLLE
jgi:hypothetical protein